jgi:large subunit ribosomal protein L10
MDKEQKAAVVEELSKELSDADAVFAIDYRGISVPQAAELRAGLRDADTRFRVVKNRLTLRAADAAGTESLKEFLEGPTALAMVNGDAALAAKTLFRLGSEWELLDYKGGLMDGEALDGDSFKAIAKRAGRGAHREPPDRTRSRPRLDDPGPGPPARPDRGAGPGQRRAARRDGGGPGRGSTDC